MRKSTIEQARSFLGDVRRGVSLLCFILLTGPSHGKADDFYTQDGSDPTFQEVMESGDLPRGRNSTKGFKGSRIRVNHDQLDDGPNAGRPLLKEIKIHTLGSSVIPRQSFSSWSRWYQEDGNTNIFRLFKDEENVRNTRKQAARIEAFSDLRWKRGEWQEWVGTYTIIKPHGAAIFQAKNNKNDWSVQLNMTDDGDVILNHRRDQDKVIAKRMTGKPFHIRIRDNGHDYEVYLNGKKEGQGSWARPQGESSFRWGMYLGANDVRHEAMLLVSGAAVNPRDSGNEVTKIEEPKPEPAPEPEPDAGLAIPMREWTNKNGDTIRAKARYEAGKNHVKLMVDSRWIQYPLKDLSEEDRKALILALEFSED